MKTKLNNHTSPRYCISMVLAAGAMSHETKHLCPSFGRAWGRADWACVRFSWVIFFYIFKPNFVGMAQNMSLDFKYQGDSHFIDANTLINTQVHFLSIVQEVSRSLNPSVKVAVKYQAFQKGSFDIRQLIEIVTVAGLFSAPHAGFIKDIISVISDYVSIKEFLKGEKADKFIEKNNGQKIEITLKGENITIHPNAFKLYQNNYSVHQAFTKSAETLLADENVDGIELIEKKGEKSLLEIGRDRFEDLASPNAYLSDEYREDIVDATIVITKPELAPKGKTAKWNFIYKARRINGVIISDIDFLKSVTAGLRFGNGDALKVDLKIVYKFDTVFKQYIEHRFEVILVKETIFNSEQSRMNFD
jgi:hypothetical protein